MATAASSSLLPLHSSRRTPPIAGALPSSLARRSFSRLPVSSPFLSSPFTSPSFYPTSKRFSSPSSSFYVKAGAQEEKKKVLVVNTDSGGHAIIGFYFARQLLGSGHEVTVLTVGEESSDKMKKPPFTRFSELVSAGGRTVWGDPAEVGKIVGTAAFDVVLDNNGKDLDAVKPVADWAKSAGVKQFLYISSAGIYKTGDEFPHLEGDPVKDDAGHVFVEKYIADLSFSSWAIFRPQYMIGSGNNKDCEEWFFDRIVRNRPVPIPGSGMELTNISHVRDLSSMLSLAVEKPLAANGKILNCVCDRAVTLDGMARLCAKAAGRELKIVHFDPKALGIDSRKAFPFRNMHFYAEPRAAKEILGRCFDPVLTIVSGLSVRDPFLLPQDKKDLAGTAKTRFAAKDYSDHMALVRAYEGWKDADREGSAYEYCWRNFLSAQTLQAIHSLRKQFNFILKDAGLLDSDPSTNNSLSHNQSLVRAIICSGLFPGIASVVHREKSMSFKTMDDGQVLLYANSVNAKYQTIPYPWLMFGEKVKVNTVFIRDSTGVSDSILILFGGALIKGDTAGHLKMLDGYLDFFMDPSLAECYWNINEELDKLIQKKLQDPSMDIHKEGKYLMLAAQELVTGDLCEGRFVFGREPKRVRSSSNDSNRSNVVKAGTNPKSLLQTLLMRAGHSPPKYKTKHLKTNEFRAIVEFKGMQFVGKPKKNKQLAERDAAIEALGWLTHTSDNSHQDDDDSPPDITDNMLKLLNGRRRRSKHRSS